MTTVLILAGGKSTRMGEDKSNMFGGVKRIYDECMKANVTRIVTLCGSNDRMHLFHGEVWPDLKIVTVFYLLLNGQLTNLMMIFY